ncbi:MAG: hypothetical protein M1828_004380 [Chrysothrix sp. TS-e1954]|nr:MAG: hypothetical protein M1828_004380 [Chrysothrix sp. TS-e1954]
MDSLAKHLDDFRAVPSKQKISMEEVLQIPPVSEEEMNSGAEKGHSHSASGGRLNAAFDFVQAGALHYTSDINYQLESESFESTTPAEDSILLAPIKDSARKELDCHVCYNLMLDPTTTPCGHTFCRKCLARILDHSNFCPVCRRRLFLPTSLTTQASNKYLSEILHSFWPSSMAARSEAALLEELSAPGGLDTPLFVCTLSFPGLRTFLHVFEPRYRLMMRRAIETNGKFGMVMYNKHLEPQGTMGRTQFLQYGTMLKIERYQMAADGRSFLECKGLHRFKVRSHGALDGYVISDVEKEEDISLADEEALEQRETSVPATAVQEGPIDLGTQLDRLPTSQLLAIGTQFVQRNREPTARWFSTRLIETYGEPPEDAATFPYWLAAVLPLMEEEKYKILTMNSARERLKLTARWIQRIEAQRW